MTNARWASSVSDAADIGDAVAQTVGDIRRQLGGDEPDLVIAFASPHHEAHFPAIPDFVQPELGGQFFGCTGGGVIGGGREVESRPGFSLSAAVLPRVRVLPFHLTDRDLAELGAHADRWAKRLGVSADEDPQFVLLPDPFSCDVERLLSMLDQLYPCSPKIGGLASGARTAGGNALWADGRIHSEGVVGLALVGDLVIDTLVAQGCRPVGEPMFVTRCHDNRIYELDGRPPLDVLRDLYERCDEDDRLLMQHSLFLGLVMAPLRENYRRGDFLIRNIFGIDAESGALAIGAAVHDNEVVQFHLRDVITSAEDLSELLGRYRLDHDGAEPVGSLLFSCLGRGKGFYGHADHDTDAFRAFLGQVPLGGFFCNGEIGAVHGTTFLHGYTSSFGLFRQKARP
ncbi:MAG TPA: FIST N-terminal domain-containing protein [Candidatus Binatia bacterium]|nr:FIST N-terminal domain-containing protein [Candidatus Binatia bacterium]